MDAHDIEECCRRLALTVRMPRREGSAYPMISIEYDPTNPEEPWRAHVGIEYGLGHLNGTSAGTLWQALALLEDEQ